MEETKQLEKKEEIAKEEHQAASVIADAPVVDSATDAPSDFEVPAKFKEMIDHVKQMSVLELHEFVKTLEGVFGVSASAVAVAAPGAGGGEAEEEKSIFTVVLKDIGAQKIAVIKVVKEALGLGLKEAKDMVESAPVDLAKDIKKEDAEVLKAKVEGAGGKVELK
jgi:large subunit ribosomal protein L7/L12